MTVEAQPNRAAIPPSGAPMAMLIPLKDVATAAEDSAVVVEPRPIANY